MSQANSFFSRLLEGLSAEIFVSVLAKVVSFDKQTRKANVQPLYKVKIDGESVDIPLLTEVPVLKVGGGGYIINYPLNNNDIVLVVFQDYDTANILLDGRRTETNTDRMHSIDDAVAVPLSLNLFTDKIEEYTDDLIVAKDDYSSRIVLSADGNITIEGGNIFLGEGASQGVPRGISLKSWLDGHVHPISWTDPAGSGFSGAPTSSSPSPSQKVKVV